MYWLRTMTRFCELGTRATQESAGFSVCEEAEDARTAVKAALRDRPGSAYSARKPRGEGICPRTGPVVPGRSTEVTR
jgi:hypothetical protein